MRKTLVKEYCAKCEYCKFDLESHYSSDYEHLIKILREDGGAGLAFYCGAQKMKRNGLPYHTNTLHHIKPENCPKLSSEINVRMKDRNNSDIETILSSIDTCNKNIEKYTNRLEDLNNKLSFLKEVESFIDENIDSIIKLNKITKLNSQIKTEGDLIALKHLVKMIKPDE